MPEKEIGMGVLSERVSYLKGLAEGLNINADTGEGKLLLAIIETLDAVSDAVTRLDEAQREMDEYVEDIDDDLSELEAMLYGDDDDDDEDGDDDEDDDDDDGLVEYDCPHCDTTIFFDEETFTMEENHLCPNCNKPVFGDVNAPDDSEDDD